MYFLVSAAHWFAVEDPLALAEEFVGEPDELTAAAADVGEATATLLLTLTAAADEMTALEVATALAFEETTLEAATEELAFWLELKAPLDKELALAALDTDEETGVEEMALAVLDCRRRNN